MLKGLCFATFLEHQVLKRLCFATFFEHRASKRLCFATFWTPGLVSVFLVWGGVAFAVKGVFIWVVLELECFGPVTVSNQLVGI